MANQAQAENQDESPADSDETEAQDAADALEDETEATEEEAEGDPPEDEEEAAARAAKEADEGKKDDEEKPDEAAPAKALKDMTPDELSAALTPEQQMRIAHKFANRTMAAARRAEKQTGAVKADNERLTGEITTYRGFVDQLQSDPMQALRRVPGFTTLKDFVQKCVAGKVDEKPEDRVAALQRRLDQREAAEKQAREQAAAEASQVRVFNALGKEPERFGRVLTRVGKQQLWNAIADYTRAHGGKCPNIQVYKLADEVEADLAADGIMVAKSSAAPAKKGTSAAGNAQAAASKPGKPTTKSTPAPAKAQANTEEEDEDEREARILREMREAGELDA